MNTSGGTAAGGSAFKGKSVRFTTYGAKTYHRPTQEDLTINCLSIPNPYNRPGNPRELIVLSPGFAVTMGLGMEKILEKLRHTEHVEIGVCCAYGQHRSPIVASLLADVLSTLGVDVKPTLHLNKVEEA